MARVRPPVPPATPTPFAAERIAGPDGVVEWLGDELTEEQAIVRLQSGRDVVVRGPSWRAN
jgi:hypothetical protein